MASMQRIELQKFIWLIISIPLFQLLEFVSVNKVLKIAGYHPARRNLFLCTFLIELLSS